MKYRQEKCFCRRKHKTRWDLEKCKMLEKNNETLEKWRAGFYQNIIISHPDSKLKPVIF